jgi:hypothetical protein
VPAGGGGGRPKRNTLLLRALRINLVFVGAAGASTRARALRAAACSTRRRKAILHRTCTTVTAEPRPSTMRASYGAKAKPQRAQSGRTSESDQVGSRSDRRTSLKRGHSIARWAGECHKTGDEAYGAAGATPGGARQGSTMGRRPQELPCPSPGHGGTLTYTVSGATEFGYDLRLCCTCGQSYYVYVTPRSRPRTSWPRRSGTDAEEQPPVHPLRRARLLPAPRVARLPPRSRR